MEAEGSAPLVSLGGVDEVLAAVREEVLLRGSRSVGAGHLARVDVQAVLALLGEAQRERHDVVGDPVAHVLAEALFLGAVLVQRGHEVGERPRHVELQLEVAAGEHQRVLVRDGLEAEEARGLGGAPLARGAVRQRHHHRLQVLAHDLELAHALELHGLSGEVLARGDGVGEDV